MNLVALVLITLQSFIVSYVDAGKVVLLVSNITLSFEDMEAQFLPVPSVKNTVEIGVVYLAEPLDACENLRNKPKERLNGTSPFVLIERGGCSFEYKVINAQRSGFKAAIVYDNVDRDILLPMGGDSDGIIIRAVFVRKAAGEMLNKYAGLADTKIMLVPGEEDSVWSQYANIALGLSLSMFIVVSTCVIVYRHCTTLRDAEFHGMSRRKVKALPSVTFASAKEDNTTAFACAICLEDYSVGDKLRVLPCYHMFHATCVDLWLTLWRTFCPVCKRDARTSTEPPASESTPLLRASTATSSVVSIDPPPPLGSSVVFTPHVSSSYIQQVFMPSSHHSQSSPINVSRISADLRQQASSPSQSSSHRSYISCFESSHSPSSTSPSWPGLVRSTNHQTHSLNHTANSFSPFASAHSLLDY